MGKGFRVGSKNRLLGGAVRIDASAYLIKWDDIQQLVNPSGCAGNGFRDNLGQARSRGFDLRASAPGDSAQRLTSVRHEVRLINHSSERTPS